MSLKNDIIQYIERKSMNLEERVKNLIVEQLGVNREQLTEDTSFTDDLGADSLDCVELVMAAEGEFGICISEEDAEGLTTVGKAITYLRKRAVELAKES